MKFCDYWELCVNALECQLALTEEKLDELEGVDFEVFTEKPECFDEVWF